MSGSQLCVCVCVCDGACACDRTLLALAVFALALGLTDALGADTGALVGADGALIDAPGEGERGLALRVYRCQLVEQIGLGCLSHGRHHHMSSANIHPREPNKIEY